ncbi:phage portal protein [Radiobacillus sp. PE A8.2]|uniref:phage portal protein n=1 Tax=Radiobacillus sp. PE A8.2 TaxID=3380349 RepID=UPI003890908B
MVTVDQIKEGIKKHKSELPRHQKNYNYYIGKHDILNRKLPDSEKPNNKIVTNYPRTVIDTTVGYYASKPISYVSKSQDQNYLSDLNNAFFMNDEEDLNAEIAKNNGIFGKCYEVHWIDKNGNQRFTQYSPLEMYVEKDSKDNIKYAFRYWTEEVKDKKVTKVEAYGDDGIYYFTSDDGKEFSLDPNEQKKNHYFGEIPVVIHKNNDEELGDFESEIPMIDNVNKLLSDSSNSIEAWVNAYLVLAGYKGTDSEDIKKMKQDGVLLLDDVGQAKFLTKEADGDFQQTFFEALDNLIHEHTATPKLTSEKFASNLSGVAIKFKLFSLEAKCSVKERKMSKALRKRIRLITKILNLKGKAYNPSEIRFQFSRNIPQNEAEITDQIVKLSDKVDDETLLSWHPRIQDPKQVIQKRNEEQDSMNLDRDVT